MGVLSRLLRSGLCRGQHGRGAVHAAARLSAAALLACAAAASAAAGDEPPRALRELAPALQPAGAGRLTWFGLRAYDARLWVAPGFRHGRFADHLFALELHYQRDFAATDIALRSVQEMTRSGPLAPHEARDWQRQLRELLPDVRAGDRIVGVHRPGQGAQFLVNGQPRGAIADARFAARFFGIWLAPTTSEPGLREALLAGTTP